MKNFQKYLLLLSLPIMACSTNRMAQERQYDDNVYVSRAKAKEIQPYIAPADNQVTQPEDQAYADQRSSEPYDYNNQDDYNDGYYDGMSYSSRIYRFHNFSPWRNYYDPFYDYRFDPFYANNLYYDNLYFRNTSIWSVNIYSGPSFGWYNPYYSWNYYYSPYSYGNYWGMNSYYHTVPYYGGNYLNPSYRDNGRTYRPRPGRNGENIDQGSWNTGNTLGNGSSRAERYGTSSVSGNAPESRNGSARPARTQENTSPQREKPNNSNNNRRSDSDNPRPSRAEQREKPASAPAQSNSPRSSNGNSDAKPRPARAGGGR